MRKGWFDIPGFQTGDRTIGEQMMGLTPAIEAAHGKSVLDLGCAEGLIAREFSRAGAAFVTGIDLLQEHVNAASLMCQGLATTFIQASLQEWIEKHPHPQRYDVVLALSIAHKLHDPGQLLDFAARSANAMVVFRGPGKDGMYWDGWLKAKHFGNRCHVPTVMARAGFAEGDTLPSGRGERVQYWHRAPKGAALIGLAEPTPDPWAGVPILVPPKKP